MWKNRIVSYSTEDPNELKANPNNFRRHPKGQRLALDAMIKDVGIVQPVIVNAASGRIIDGHLRVELAVERGEHIPVIWVDVTPEEEMKILATLDPIGNMATTDGTVLDQLIKQLTPPDQIIADVWDSLRTVQPVMEEIVDWEKNAVQREYDFSSQERYLNASYRSMMMIFPLAEYDEIVRKLDDLLKAKNAASNQDIVLELIRREHANEVNIH